MVQGTWWTPDLVVQPDSRGNMTIDLDRCCDVAAHCDTLDCGHGYTPDPFLRRGVWAGEPCGLSRKSVTQYKIMIDNARSGVQKVSLTIEERVAKQSDIFHILLYWGWVFFFGSWEAGKRPLAQ